MTCAWILNIVGLAFNTIAAILMYYFPPRVQLFTEKGESLVMWLSNSNEKKAAIGKRQILLAKFGPALLALGFSLQLVSVFLSV
jgi:hypothetical protein